MTGKILIVDDEPEMLRALKRIFSRKGHTVVTAQCGEEAWKYIEETMFDLVISDMAMEDLSGLELLKLVRSTDATTPFIIITGVGTIESAVESIQMGIRFPTPTLASPPVTSRRWRYSSASSSASEPGFSSRILVWT